MNEEWVIIARAPDYAVSNLGRVRRETQSHLKSAGSILRSPTTGKGYYRIPLWVREDGRRVVRCFFVHRLVADAFLPPCPGPGYAVAHEDGNPKNNRVENLSWKTHAENNRDRSRHGTMPRGETHPQVKLKANDIHKIRGLLSLGFLSFADIAKRYTVSPQVISRIAHGRTWSHLP